MDLTFSSQNWILPKNIDYYPFPDRDEQRYVTQTANKKLRQQLETIDGLVVPVFDNSGQFDHPLQDSIDERLQFKGVQTHGLKLLHQQTKGAKRYSLTKFERNLLLDIISMVSADWTDEIVLFYQQGAQIVPYGFRAIPIVSHCVTCVPFHSKLRKLLFYEAQVMRHSQETENAQIQFIQDGTVNLNRIYGSGHPKDCPNFDCELIFRLQGHHFYRDRFAVRELSMEQVMQNVSVETLRPSDLALPMAYFAIRKGKTIVTVPYS